MSGFADPPEVAGQLRGRVISGVSWSGVSQIGRQGLQFAIFVVLARFLGPEEFGLTALVVVFSGFATIISDPGFGAAIIHRKDLEERHCSSVFWVSLAVGLALSTLFALLSPVVAWFFHEPALIWLTIVMGLQFSISPFELIQDTLLTRAMEFRRLALAELTATLVGGIVGAVLAVNGFGVWSLVAMALTRSGASVIALWVASDWRPRLICERRAIKELMAFSAGIFGFKMVNYWLRKGDDLLVGRYFGPLDLGLYDRAYSLMLLPLTQVTWVVGRVLFPALAGIQSDPARIKRIYLRAVSMIALVSAPVSLGLLAVADNFVLGLLGAKWAGILPALKIFCPLGFVQSIDSSLGWIAQARGRTDIQFAWAVIAGSVILAGFVLGVWLGSIEAVALVYAITTGIVLFYPGVLYHGRLIDMNFLDVFRASAGSLGCAVVMAACVWALDVWVLADHLPHVARLVIQIATGIVLYTLMIKRFTPGNYNEALAIFARRTPAPPVRDS